MLLFGIMLRNTMILVFLFDLKFLNHADDQSPDM
jgi:hypothetical protein